ncbi:extracellular solute-binding protein [Nocardioides sp. BP30]|uniref:ABC transporter substrate-binding protein n=1 Tax=Nocardioides sp. BP30 TaxID=3036374 RepID=UPI0024694C8D|nr:extracellular solute-binding protein [Nocardioides sp. BP30]WGL51803.1 extracellular solute-binding protein [Nocardioides sp. BP30]
MRTVAGAIAVIGALVLSGCGGGDHPAKRSHAPRPSATASAEPTALTVGFYGTADEIAAYKQAVDNYDAAQQSVTLTLETWPTAAAMMTDLAAGKPAPDVFLAGRGDLDVLEQDKLISPVDELLAARNVDLGDAYSREALEAFSADRHLTCMPYAATPQVIYYNTDLIDFTTMKAEGLATPGNLDSGRWTVPTFAAAVEWASRPATGERALSLPTSVEGLAPYLYSGKGKVVDDESKPTSLAFSDPSNQSTWDQLLPVLSGHGAMLSAKQLKKHSPLQWFERGKLGMLVGDRSLVPELRKQPGLHWDVISLPSVSGTTTIGDYSGLCLSAHTKQTQAAADLLAYLVSKPAVSLVAQSGFIVPVNTEVAMSDDFLQPTQQPLHAKVFVNNTRSMHILPIPSATLVTLDGQVGGLVAQLLKPAADVGGTTAQIDATSKPIFEALNASLSPSPSASATATGSGGS